MEININNKNNSLLNNLTYTFIIIIISLIFTGSSIAETENKEAVVNRTDVQEFIAHMVNKYNFNKSHLDQLFSKVTIDDKVIAKISKPAEGLPWSKYKKIFLNEDRIQKGVEFWKNNKATLDRAKEVYGVDPEIIVAIIGVETKYGKIKGNHDVLTALTTLAFEFPRRSKFFKSELEHFLVLTKEQGFDPSTMKGSYAGAMGMPQFISSSWRNFAVDFSNSGDNDIIYNVENAIGSTANYFNKHGWVANAKVAELQSNVKGNYKNMLSSKRHPKPNLTNADFAKAGVKLDQDFSGKVALLGFNDDTEDAQTELWLGYNNFYAITRYNNSSNYAMAAYMLSQEIKKRYEATLT